MNILIIIIVVALLLGGGFHVSAGLVHLAGLVLFVCGVIKAFQIHFVLGIVSIFIPPVAVVLGIVALIEGF